MISTRDPRIPRRIQTMLERLLRPGEVIRRPKHEPIDRERMVAEFVRLVHDGWTREQTYAKLGLIFRCSRATVIRTLRGRPTKYQT